MELTIRAVRTYRQTSNISHTTPQNLNVFRLVLQLFLPNPLKPGVTLRMKMYVEQRRQAMLQLHLSDQQIYYLLLFKLRHILQTLWYCADQNHQG